VAAGKEEWYMRILDFWKQQPADANWVLGDLEAFISPDVPGSRKFLRQVK